MFLLLLSLTASVLSSFYTFDSKYIFVSIFLETSPLLTCPVHKISFFKTSSLLPQVSSSVMKLFSIHCYTEGLILPNNRVLFLFISIEIFLVLNTLPSFGKASFTIPMHFWILVSHFSDI